MRDETVMKEGGCVNWSCILCCVHENGVWCVYVCYTRFGNVTTTITTTCRMEITTIVFYSD